MLSREARMCDSYCDKERLTLYTIEVIPLPPLQSVVAGSQSFAFGAENSIECHLMSYV